MKFKRAISALGVTTCIATGLLSDGAWAQSVGSLTLATGWLRVMPLARSDPMFIQSVAGTPVNQSVPNTGGHLLMQGLLGKRQPWPAKEALEHHEARGGAVERRSPA
ncbi:hypothetical protein [Paraburkholderia sp. MM5477-R1]|uniref:hypothetical protein n=1 Tax=Paraburkholderia sp. MM5477-R1 TaxID=2991062 RepID=UPI003D1E9807